MGIVKAVSGVPIAKSDYKCEDEDITQEERLLFQRFPGHETDDCEIAEVDCELATSGGQTCNVPYGLYDLAELKDILSLETWNVCLTEEDRFRLAAYLPDMDQHDFFTTMQELLSGSAMFFGSPLRTFFYRLNGGFYSPEVSQGRELLMGFQRRRYYHFLKSYHDDMIWKFACMDTLWRRSGVSASLGEKVYIWHNWRQEKLLTLTDLNSSPFNRSLSNVGRDEAASSSFFKRAMLMDGIVTTRCSAKNKEIVHRAKPIETSTSKRKIFQHPSEPSERCSELPKGVVKIMTDYASLTDGNGGIHHKQGMSTLDHLGMQVSIFSPHASAQDGYDISLNSSYSYHINTSRSTSGMSSSRPWHCEGALDTYPVLFRTPLGVQHSAVGDLKRGNYSAMPRGYQSAARHTLPYSHEANDLIESPQEKNFLTNFGRQNALIPESFPDTYARTTGGHRTNEYMKMPSPRNAESVSEMLTLGTTTDQSYNFPEQAESTRKYHDGLVIKVPPAMESVTEIEKERKFPYTYTRRKLHKGLNLVESVQKSTMSGSESSSVLATSMANVKAKAIKL